MQKLSFTIDSKDSGKISRFIWQQIFVIYLEKKCLNLYDLDSMLFDLSGIQKRISYAFKYNRIVKFCWYINSLETGVKDTDDGDDVIHITFNPRTGELDIAIPEEFS